MNSIFISLGPGPLNAVAQLVECLTGDWMVADSSQQRHCVVSSSKTLYPLLSTGSTKEDPSQHDWKIDDWDVKNQTKPIPSFRFFFKIGGPNWPMEQKIVGHFLKWWAQAYQTKHSCHLDRTFTYTLTQTLVCIYVYIDCWLYSKHVLSDHSKRPKIGFQDRLLHNAGQKYCRMDSAILSAFIKLPFVIKIFVLSFEWLHKTGFTVLITYMYFLFCWVCRLAVRWIFLLNWEFFSQLKRMGPLGPLPWIVMGHILKSWTMTWAHHKYEDLHLSTHIYKCLGP